LTLTTLVAVRTIVVELNKTILFYVIESRYRKISSSVEFQDGIPYAMMVHETSSSSIIPGIDIKFQIRKRVLYILVLTEYCSKVASEVHA
jgi:hypothetical protein